MQDGKVLAVDISIWLVQAMTQSNMSAAIGENIAQCIKVVFERTIHMLRFGITPVFVIDGRAPAAKLACQIKRSVEFRVWDILDWLR